MQDEARHVMFGRLALRDYYPQLTQAERDEREEFCVDACYRMRDRFLGEEVWRTLELPRRGHGVGRTRASSSARSAASSSCASCPILKDIGLWGPQIQRAFTDMGVIAFADTDIDAAMAEDEQVAEEIDREQDVRLAHVQAVAGDRPAACGPEGQEVFRALRQAEPDAGAPPRRVVSRRQRLDHRGRR